MMGYEEATLIRPDPPPPKQPRRSPSPSPRFHLRLCPSLRTHHQHRPRSNSSSTASRSHPRSSTPLLLLPSSFHPRPRSPRPVQAYTPTSPAQRAYQRRTILRRQRASRSLSRETRPIDRAFRARGRGTGRGRGSAGRRAGRRRRRRWSLRDRGRRAIRDCENGSAGCEEEKNRGRVGRRSRRGWSGRRSWSLGRRRWRLWRRRERRKRSVGDG
jgi:hypothetical protein